MRFALFTFYKVSNSCIHLAPIFSIEKFLAFSLDLLAISFNLKGSVISIESLCAYSSVLNGLISIPFTPSSIMSRTEQKELNAKGNTKLHCFN